MHRRSFLVLAALVVCCARSIATSDVSVAFMRVVSFLSSMIEIVVAFGAFASFVGRSRYCDWPPEVIKFLEVGGYVDPNLEAILALRPDLVVGVCGLVGRRIDDMLRVCGVATYFPSIESVDDIFTMICGLGARLCRDADGERVIAGIESRLASIAAATKKVDSLRVLLFFGVQSIVAVGPKSFGDEILVRAGGRNVVTQGGSYPSLDFEVVVALDPDVIVDVVVAEEYGGQRITKASGGWSRVRVVQNDRVLLFVDESVLRLGPRVGEGVAILARVFHPGLDLC